MFTGLIEAVGTVAELKTAASGFRIRIQTSLAADLSPGDSLAVNGVCLTVIAADGRRSARRHRSRDGTGHHAGSMRGEQQVNLERPMRADGRVGGHFVQGHIDGTGIVEEIRPDGDSHWLTISFDRSLSPYLDSQGLDRGGRREPDGGGLGGNVFDAMIIPFTWSNTALSSLKVRERVNIECDMIGSYVARAIELTEDGRLKPAPTT